MFKRYDRVAYIGRPSQEWSYYPTYGTVTQADDSTVTVKWDKTENHENKEPVAENPDNLQLV
jgi:hypothetical protein